jgi:ATP-dependent Clp protease ATP-binding subunit ClpC
VFEHFTDGARRILLLAQQEAQSPPVSSIGPEHLFLGMLRAPEGIAGNALKDTGADYNRARALLVEHRRGQTGRGSDREPFSEATLAVMERSLQISWARADAGIGAEHLLVALLEQDDDATEAVLAGLDITPEEVLLRVEALLAERNRWSATQSPSRRREAT